MEIPDCYDPIYQAERREAEADEKALHCESCGRLIRFEYWEINDNVLCERCAEIQYRHNVEDLDYV